MLGKGEVKMTQRTIQAIGGEGQVYQAHLPPGLADVELVNVFAEGLAEAVQLTAWTLELAPGARIILTWNNPWVGLGFIVSASGLPAGAPQALDSDEWAGWLAGTIPSNKEV